MENPVESIPQPQEERPFNYEAAHSKFLDVIAYWPPEWVNDPDMFEKMLSDVMWAGRNG